MDAGELERLISAVGERLGGLLRGADERGPAVCGLVGPQELARRFVEVGAPLELGAGPGVGVEGLMRAIDEVIAGSVRTLHPRFFNQNFAGADPVAVLGDWLGAALNTTMATYEAAPVFTLMERAVLERMAALAGWSTHDGIFTAGGSLSNLHALQLARLRVDPECGERGASGERLVGFTSAHAHYSLGKAAALLGLGRRGMVAVGCDARGRMVPGLLARAIAAARAGGERPFFVNATAGTTVLGAFDPLPEIAELCAAEGLWLHVDGCFGASALCSPRERGRMAGVERADSLAWNLHKMLGATQQCSALLVREPGALRAGFASDAAYLFQPDRPHAALDSGDRTFQCARRVDALKAWLTWKARGEAGLAARVEHAVDLATLAAGRVADDPRFVQAAPRSWVNLCFWWVPPELRPLDRSRPGVDAALHAVAPRIKAEMLRRGQAMLGYQPVDGGPNCFRLLCINPAVRAADLEFVLEHVDACGLASR